MRKSAVILGLIAFVICGVLGFFAARQTLNPSSTTQDPPETPATQIQQNFILLLVDDLEQANPNLNSAWFMLLYKGSSPNINFQLIYPVTNFPDRSLKNQFTLTDGGALDPAFIQLVHNQYQITIDNYIILDKYALNRIAEWLGASELVYDPSDSDSMITEQTHLLEQGCAFMKSPSINTSSPFDWVSLVPNHMRTDLTFEQAISSWKQLADQYTLLSCDIFGSK